MNARTLFLIVLFLMVGGAAFFYFNREIVNKPKSEQDYPNPILKVGGVAPSLELSDLDGKTHRLEDYRGKVVLINFWASWCPPCLIEMPSLVSVYKQFNDKGFEILAINLDENTKSVDEFLKSMDIPFKIFLDPKGAAAQTYLVYGLPYTVLLDREGKVQFKVFGGHDWDQGEPFEKIKSLL